MKSSLVISLGTLSILLITITGCQPKLAESPYGAREKQWEDFIKETYPDWEPPKTEPPTRVAAPRDTPSDLPEFIEDDTAIVETGSPAVETPAVVETETAVVETSPEYQTYTVQKGDTLWSISRKFYGVGKKWRTIFQANQDIISNPDKIRAGTEIKIPANAE